MVMNIHKILKRLWTAVGKYMGFFDPVVAPVPMYYPPDKSKSQLEHVKIAAENFERNFEAKNILISESNPETVRLGIGNRGLVCSDKDVRCG